MAVSVTSQVHVFLFSLLGGAFAGTVFDMFRALRRLIRGGTVWVGIQDLLFWLFSACASFLFLYRFNDGQPRWYIFCGILLGAAIYTLLLRDYMVRLFTCLARIIVHIIRFLVQILLFPFAVLYRIFRPLFLFLYKIARKIVHFFKRKIRAIRVRISLSAKKIKKRLKMY